MAIYLPWIRNRKLPELKKLIYLAKKYDLEGLAKKSFYPFKAALIIIIDALGVAGWRKS